MTLPISDLLRMNYCTVSKNVSHALHGRLEFVEPVKKEVKMFKKRPKLRLLIEKQRTGSPQTPSQFAPTILVY